MSYDLQRGSDRVSLDILARRPDLTVAVEGRVHHIEELRHGEQDFELRIDGRPVRGRRCITATEIQVRLDGQTFVFQRLHGIRQNAAAGGSGDAVLADMPGTVIACHVAPGDQVSAGQRLVTIESMKLQMTIPAPRDGVVAALPVGENVTFERGAVLVALVPAASETKTKAETGRQEK